MIKKITNIISVAFFALVVAVSSSNAAVLTPGANHDVDFGSSFTGIIGSSAGTSHFYDFTALVDTVVRFDVTPLQASGVPNGVESLVLTWDDGPVAHQITGPGSAVSVTLGQVTFFHSLVQDQTYRLSALLAQYIGNNGGYILDVSAVPLPPAVIAFATAMLGVGFLARRKRKKKALFA